MFTSHKGFVSLGFAALFLSGSAFAVEEVSITDAPVDTNHIQLNYSAIALETFGQFDPYGNYTAYPNGASAWTLINSFDVDYRFNKEWEAGVSFAVRDSESTFSDANSRSYSMGSPSLEGRFYVPNVEVVHLIVHAGLTLPWSMGPRFSSGDQTQYFPPDMVDTSLLGFAVRAGVGVSKSFRPLPIRLTFDVTGTFPLPQTSNQYANEPPGGPQITSVAGKRLGIREGASYSITPRWSVIGGLTQTWTDDNTSNGLDQTISASRLFSSSIGISYMPDHIWKYSGTFSTPFPFYSVAINQAYADGVGLNVSYSGL